MPMTVTSDEPASCFKTDGERRGSFAAVGLRWGYLEHEC